MVERDIGAVVAPDADEVYLTASAAEQARRRSAQDSSDSSGPPPIWRGGTSWTPRATDPLRQAPDAVEVNTDMDIGAVVSALHELLRQQVEQP